jgi:hypothetical protein
LAHAVAALFNHDAAPFVWLARRAFRSELPKPLLEAALKCKSYLPDTSGRNLPPLAAPE